MVVVGIVASLELRLQRDVLLRVPSYPPEVLAQKARETAILLGYSKPPEDSHQSLMSNHGLFAYLATLPPARSAAWLAVENPLEAEYRASPSFLIARPSGLVTSYDPPFDEPGMVRVVVDGSGRLREFAAVPYAAAGEVSQSMFEAAFRAMGFDFSRFHEVAATGLPNAPVSQLKTWKGPHPSFPDVELSVDIGSANGGITWSRVRFPWDPGQFSAAAFAVLSGVIARTHLSFCGGSVTGGVLGGAQLETGESRSQRGFPVSRCPLPPELFVRFGPYASRSGLGGRPPAI